MLLDLRKIIEMPGGSVPFSVELDPQDLNFASVKEHLSCPKAEGRVFNEAGVLHMEGECRAEMLCSCDRCGKDFTMEKLTQLRATIVEEDTGDDPELFLLDGDGVDIEDMVRTLFILDMETKFLCREDCKGLCSTCGKDLNLGPCDCGKKIDPRFAVLEQLLDK